LSRVIIFPTRVISSPTPPELGHSEFLDYTFSWLHVTNSHMFFYVA
jgi:hypothetical protein